MTDDAELIRGRLLAVLAQQSAEPLSSRLCRAAPAIVGVDSAGVCLVDTVETRMLIAASDPLAESLESLQLELGEGPCVQAASTRTTVMISNAESGAVDPSLWMYLRRVASETPIRGVFSFPIAVGSIAIGALDLYNRVPGALSDSSVAAAVMLADFLALALLAEQTGASTGEAELDWLGESPDARVAVHQATGVIIAQLNIGPEAAIARLRAHAFRSGVPLTEVAHQVLAHEIYLEP